VSHQINSTQSSTDLRGKTALITGAAQRVGAQICRSLHHAGANVVIHYRHSDTSAKQLQAELNTIRANSAASIAADLNDISGLSPMVEFAEKQWGSLDILINNASRFYPTPIGSVTEAHWDDLINSNVKAAFFLAQAATPYLQKRSGVIINIIDIHADRPLKSHPVYCIAKAGLAMLTKSLACELGPEIRVNGVAPGAILWPENDMDDETKTNIVNKTFLKQKGDPQDIARAVLYLVQDAHYTTGQILAVDGGRSLKT